MPEPYKARVTALALVARAVLGPAVAHGVAAIEGIRDGRALQVSAMWLTLSAVSLVVLAAARSPGGPMRARWSCAATAVAAVGVITAAASPVAVSPVAATWVLLAAAVIGAARPWTLGGRG